MTPGSGSLQKQDFPWPRCSRTLAEQGPLGLNFPSALIPLLPWKQRITALRSPAPGVERGRGGQAGSHPGVPLGDSCHCQRKDLPPLPSWSGESQQPRQQLVGEEAISHLTPREQLPKSKALSHPLTGWRPGAGPLSGWGAPLSHGLVRKPAISASELRALPPRQASQGVSRFPPSQSPEGDFRQGWSGLLRTPPAETHLHPQDLVKSYRLLFLFHGSRSRGGQTGKRQGPAAAAAASWPPAPGGSGAEPAGTGRARRRAARPLGLPESAPNHRLPMKGSIMNLLGAAGSRPSGETGSGAATGPAASGEGSNRRRRRPRSGPARPLRHQRAGSGRRGPAPRTAPSPARAPRHGRPLGSPPSWTPRLAFRSRQRMPARRARWSRSPLCGRRG